MKTFKKICLGVGLVALFAVVFQVFPASKALAAGGPINGESEWRQATYTMNQKSTIIVNLAGNDHDNINFNSTSKAGVYKADTNNTGVCDGQITFSSGQTLSSHPIKATINVDYMNSASGMPTCTAGAHNGANDSYSSSISITNNTTDGGQQGADTGPKTISYQGDTYTQLNTTSYKTVYGASTDINSCYGGSLIVLAKVDSKANAPVTGTLISISGPVIGGGELISKHVPYWPVSNNPSVPGLGSCSYNAGSDGQDDLLTVAADGTAKFKCSTTDGKTCVAPTPTKPTPADTTASCEANFNSPFAWLFCPAFGIADDAANQFNSFVQDQLCFNTGSTSSSAGGFVCGGNNNLTSGVHNAWNIFKDLASAIIIIALLIMIISQAIGSGPFDAYTVKKMLPRLVIAVIIMQVSWPLLKWVIDVSNDAGATVGNLIMAPFGGPSHLTLDHLLTQNLGTHTTTTNNEFSFFVVLAAGVGALALSIPGLAMMGLYVVLALFTAFVVLLFRKMLIVLLVILAPIAFATWVLPGTERYWKMWRENFTKLVLMFPMIMALIAAGKIFASIAAGTNSSIIFSPHVALAHLGSLPVPYLASVTNFINFAIIVGAYFAPFFLLPQTFKWGGAAMGSIANGVHKGVEKGAKPAKDYLDWRKSLSPWKQARAARKAEIERQSKLNFARRLGTQGVMGSVRRARLGGVPRPTPGGIRGERELRSNITRTAEEKLREEEIKEEGLALERQYGQMARDDELAALETEALSPHSNEYRVQAALQRLAQLRGGGQLMRVRDHLLTNGRGEEWNRAIHRNFDAFNSTSPMFTNGATQAMMAANGGQGRTFTADEDMDYMTGQNDQTIASQSGSGWNLYNQQALAAGRLTEVQQVYRRIMTSGQPYAGGVNPNAHNLYGGGRPLQPPAPGPGAVVTPNAGVAPGSRTAEVIGWSDSDVLREVNRAARAARAANPAYAGNGWDQISSADLLRIYNYRTGNIKVQAENELRTRGIII